jgi:hypothetical protein
MYTVKYGYLLTTHGNPIGNAVREGDKIIVHSANGLDFEVPVLKSIHLNDKWQNKNAAITAKIQPPEHTQKIECYGYH